jgi:ABC-type Zn uptake system ZnuABC Zn-binding protein ZnuA
LSGEAPGRRRIFRFSLAALFCLSLTAAEPGRPLVIATTTLISTVVHDLAGEAVEVQVLMPAGTCPGQFDLQPRQARDIPRAALILRHEHQGFLDALFLAAGAAKGTLAGPRGGFTVPEAYARYCAAVARELGTRLPSLEPALGERNKAIDARMDALATQLRSRAAPLAGKPVVVTTFQVELITWLGLRPVAVFPPAEDPVPSLIQSATRAGREQNAMLVIGNVQNGDRLPRAIASALGLPCVMLSNFPTEDSPGSQDRLIEENLSHLLPP